MTTTHLALALTVINLGLFVVQLVRMEKAEAPDGPEILRGSGIEIVDDEGRLRAQLKLEPANAAFEMPDGSKGYPETVIFRLITSDGKPRVKLTTSEEGSGLMLLGNSDDTQAIVHADGTKSSLKLRNDELTQQLIAP